MDDNNLLDYKKFLKSVYALPPEEALLLVEQRLGLALPGDEPFLYSTNRAAAKLHLALNHLERAEHFVEKALQYPLPAPMGATNLLAIPLTIGVRSGNYDAFERMLAQLPHPLANEDAKVITRLERFKHCLTGEKEVPAEELLNLIRLSAKWHDHIEIMHGAARQWLARHPESEAQDAIHTALAGISSPEQAGQKKDTGTYKAWMAEVKASPPEEGLRMIEARLAQSLPEDMARLCRINRMAAQLHMALGHTEQAEHHARESFKQASPAENNMEDTLVIFLQTGDNTKDYSAFDAAMSQLRSPQSPFVFSGAASERLVLLKSCLTGRDVKPATVEQALNKWSGWTAGKDMVCTAVSRWLINKPPKKIRNRIRALLLEIIRDDAPAQPAPEVSAVSTPEPILAPQTLQPVCAQRFFNQNTFPAPQIMGGFDATLFPDTNFIARLAMPIPQAWIRRDLPPGVEAPKTFLDIFMHTASALHCFVLMSDVMRLEATGFLNGSQQNPSFFDKKIRKGFGREALEALFKSISLNQLPHAGLFHSSASDAYLKEVSVLAGSKGWKAATDFQAKHKGIGESDIECMIYDHPFPGSVYIITEDRDAREGRFTALRTAGEKPVGVMNTKAFLKTAEALGIFRAFCNPGIGCEQAMRHIRDTRRSMGEKGPIVSFYEKNSAAGTPQGEMLNFRQFALQQAKMNKLPAWLGNASDRIR